MNTKPLAKQNAPHYLWGENKGLYIEAGKRHRIMNRSDSDLEILLSSQPTTKGDRINLQ